MNGTRLFKCALVGLALTLTACTSTKQDAALRIIAAEGAPKAAGPYSQGVVANGFLYTAGQTPRDPGTGNQVGGDIASHRPARTTVQVSKLPGNAPLEIDMVARVPH